jgi:hypothetical protein
MVHHCNSEIGIYHVSQFCSSFYRRIHREAQVDTMFDTRVYYFPILFNESVISKKSHHYVIGKHIFYLKVKACSIEFQKTELNFNYAIFHFQIEKCGSFFSNYANSQFLMPFTLLCTF